MICSLDGSGLLVYNLPRRTSTSLIEIPAEDQVFKLNTFTPKGDQGKHTFGDIVWFDSQSQNYKQCMEYSADKWYVGLRSERGHNATEYKSQPAEVDLHTPI